MAKSKFAKFKKEVEKLVQETLEENKRVILPNVGVLIAQGSDRLVFNEFIKFNDNVLAKKIAANEKISQEEALFKLTAFIQELTVELTNHNYFKFGKIGVFTLGSNGKITFFQSVDDAEKFVRKPILDDPDGILPEKTNQEQVIAPPSEKENPVEEAPKPKKRGRPKKVVEETKKEEVPTKKADIKKEEKKIAKVEKNIAKVSEAMVSFDIPQKEDKPKETEKLPVEEKSTPAESAPLAEETKQNEIVSESNTVDTKTEGIAEPKEEIEAPKELIAEPNAQDSTTTKDSNESETSSASKTEKPEVEKQVVANNDADQPKSLQELGFKNKLDKTDSTSKTTKAIEAEPASPDKGQSVVLIAATVVVLVCLAAIWFLVFQKKSNEGGVTINDITITEELNDENAPSLEQVDSLEAALYPTDSVSSNSTYSEAEQQSNQDATPETPTIQNQPKQETANQSTEPKSTNAEFHHHVVAGSFSTLVKAQQKVKELKAEGFESAQVIGERNSMYSVSYGSFATKAEANTLLQSVKKTHTGAWYLKF